jgi:hypothetical protein
MPVMMLGAASNQPTYPNKEVTPGAADPKITQDNIAKTICRHGSTKDSRHVTSATKREVFKRYGLDYSKEHGKFEVDHFISLELGGLNDISNLWPQRYEPRPGAREKDVVETHLKREICKGLITLEGGRAIITKDWFACYRVIKAGKECTP